MVKDEAYKHRHTIKDRVTEGISSRFQVTLFCNRSLSQCSYFSFQPATGVTKAFYMCYPICGMVELVFGLLNSNFTT